MTAPGLLFILIYYSTVKTVLVMKPAGNKHEWRPLTDQMVPSPLLLEISTIDIVFNWWKRCVPTHHILSSCPVHGVVCSSPKALKIAPRIVSYVEQTAQRSSMYIDGCVHRVAGCSPRYFFGQPIDGRLCMIYLL